MAATLSAPKKKPWIEASLHGAILIRKWEENPEYGDAEVCAGGNNVTSDHDAHLSNEAPSIVYLSRILISMMTVWPR